MDFTQYITENSLILIPVLYILGLMIKQSESIQDKFIPLILLWLAICFSLFLEGLSIHSVIQGVLIAGTTVYTHQIIKQFNKEK